MCYNITIIYERSKNVFWNKNYTSHEEKTFLTCEMTNILIYKNMYSNIKKIYIHILLNVVELGVTFSGVVKKGAVVIRSGCRK